MKMQTTQASPDASQLGTATGDMAQSPARAGFDQRLRRAKMGSGVAVAIALLVTSCNSDSNSTAEAQSPATTPATTAAAPATTLAPATTAAASASESLEATRLATARPKLEALTAALAAGDLEASHDALEAYDAVWNGNEIYIQYRSLSTYLKLEADLQVAIEEGLASDAPNFAEMKTISEELSAVFEGSIAAAEQGPALNPLFDDLATVRIIRADLRITNAALDDGKVEKAAEYFATFAENFFNDAYPLLKLRNEESAEVTEIAVDDAVAAFADATKSAEDLASLTGKVLSEYNYGVGLVNAAARGFDPSKTELTTLDLIRLSQLHDVRILLLKSMKAWTAGDFDTAASVAEVAGTRAFDQVKPALIAKGADGALKSLLDSYVALAGAAGDAKEVGDANRAAVRAIGVAEQAILGQFWADAEVQEYVAGLPDVDSLT